MLFEAYQKIYEAPVDPGQAWDDSSADVAKKFKGLMIGKKPKKDVRDLLTQYGLDDESQIKAIDAMKNFLAQFDDRHYPGNVRNFREDALEHMMAETGLPKTDARYATRVLQNAVTHLNVFSVDGDEIKIQDVEKLDNTKNVLNTPVKDMPVITAPTSLDKFSLNSTYTIDIISIDENLPRIQKELLDYVQEGMTGQEILYTLKNTIIFRNPESTGGLDSDINKLRTMVVSWVKSGILKQEERSKESQKEIEDLGIGKQSPHAAGDYLSSQGISVPKADAWSGEVSDW
jgi:hypothetical protein